VNVARALCAVVLLGVAPTVSAERPGGGGDLAVQLAQAAATPAGTPVRIRGRITAVAEDRVVVATDGGEVRVALNEPLRIVGVEPAHLSDIAPGTFIGTAARTQPDGTLRALEVHIFPEAMRGTGEGHRPMDAPETTMTNAAVEEAVQSVDGPVLTLKYRGGQVRVLVSPETPVVRMVAADRRLLTPGTAVSIRAARGADDSLSASSIVVGIGIVPPM
jgi:hypothetical protein